ncbi:MAG: cytochrome P450 [Acidimicrobiia bacterium]|nr:cytochrome P450 [Acidimicrobiia bacterium]MDH5236696.1 cytochrome P450 [Acidimicrobiia bacterium]
MEPIDFCDSTLYDDPWDTYRWLRADAPMYRDEVNDLWVVSRYADVVNVSRHPERYCSREGVRPRGASDLSLLAMDDPEHTRVRRLVNKGFTPRQVREILPHVRELSAQLAREIGTRGEVDFVGDVAMHVPLIVIAELLGLDPDARLQLYRWSDDMMGGDGRTEPDDPALLAAMTAFGEYTAVLQELIDARRADPSDDLISVLTQAHDSGALAELAESTTEQYLVDGDALDEHELLLFLVTLLVAGNETTRNAISGGLLALSRFPDEHARLVQRLDDEAFVDLAVDELIRFVSPVLSFTRTVTEDHLYRGEDFTQELRAGDRVLMLYQSANRDERVFDDPEVLRLDRDPNPHVAFGIGTHYCLGANLARMEVKVVFEELLRHLPDLRVPDGAGAERGQSTLVLALNKLPAVFTPVTMAS